MNIIRYYVYTNGSIKGDKDQFYRRQQSILEKCHKKRPDDPDGKPEHYGRYGQHRV